MGEPERKIRDVLPSVTNIERLEILKRSLRDRLDRIDQATRWSAASYVPLEAEVQVLEGQTSKRKIVDLMRALRTERMTRIFVVLGEPGSGKSVALRKLARDLLEKSQSSDRIPIYLNLKEWKSDRTWTLDNPPTERDFHDFVLRNLQDDLDYNSQAFLRQKDSETGKTIYERLFEAGYLFFILDSFDEIPAVLDHEETSWLIETLSDCIVGYVLSGHRARAVISSRLFRKPKIIHNTRSIYEITPFSDDRVIKAVELGADSPDVLSRIILTERADLGAIARNPFLLHLIISYYNNNQRPPTTQAEMFQAYVDANLQLARETYRFREVDNSAVTMIAEDISHAMFQEENTGLEISETELRNYISNPLLPHVLRFLTQSRLGRLGGETGTFSFAHRRFNEYFLVRRLSREQGSISLDAIQTDSRLRDALVLYAEIAPDNVAQQLVSHAWSYARNIDTVSLTNDRAAFIQARNALRFLIEGFRNRRAPIAHLTPHLARIVRSRLNSKFDFLETRTVLEAVSLLDHRTTYRVIILALRKLPPWLTETAATAARYLPKASTELLMVMFDNTIARYGVMEATRQREVFRLSHSTHKIASWLLLFRLDIIKAYLSIAILAFVSAYYLSPFAFVGVLGGIGLVTTMKGLDWVMPSIVAVLFNKISKSEGSPGSIKYIKPRKNSIHVFAHASILLRSKRNIVFMLLISQLVMSVIFYAASRMDFTSIGNDQPNTPKELFLLNILICCFGLIPTSPATWVRFKHSATASIVPYLIGGLIGATLFPLAMAYVLNVLSPWMRIVVMWSILLLLGLPIVLLECISMLGLFRGLYSDYYIFKRAKLSFAPNRRWISEVYLALRTNHFRSKFLDWLEGITLNYTDQLGAVADKWPVGRPQVPGDKNSIRLAQLDARWSGID
jgi:hypothetical protein